jgi:hypothetical protein
MSAAETSGMAEKIEIVLIDGETGKVKKHLRSTEFGVVDVEKEKKINELVTTVLLERMLRERRKLMEAIMFESSR